VRLDGFCKLEKQFFNLIGSETHDLPSYYMEPQPLRHRLPPEEEKEKGKGRKKNRADEVRKNEGFE
jgi:hypothetical protein